MMFVLLLFVLLAVLGPLVGADTRDSLDWAPAAFWRRRRDGLRHRAPRPERPVDTAVLRASHPLALHSEPCN
jgi:hypothetical protein